MEPITTRRTYYPYVSPFDPCPPIIEKTYVIPPNKYMVFQPYNLEQFSPREALYAGTLWKFFYDPYYNPYEKKRG